MNKIEESMQIILHAGNATTKAYEAIDAAKNNNFEKSEKLINEAKNEEIQAHLIQSSMLKDFSNGVETNVDILMSHSQDHLAMATVNIKMAKEILDLYKCVSTFMKGGK